jgi:hypothetical protein
VCEHVKGDLDINITQDGHGVSLRAGRLGADQEGASQAGGSRLPSCVGIFETKHTASDLAVIGGTTDDAGAAHEAGKVCRQGHLRPPDLQDEACFHLVRTSKV